MILIVIFVFISFPSGIFYQLDKMFVKLIALKVLSLVLIDTLNQMHINKFKGYEYYLLTERKKKPDKTFYTFKKILTEFSGKFSKKKVSLNPRTGGRRYYFP